MNTAKTCADCKFSFFVPAHKYRMCQKTDGLCGEARKAPCGPEAVLYEKK